MGRISNKALLEKITKYLLDKGFRPNIKGFKYLRKAIELTIKNGCEAIPMTKEMYPRVATEFADTPARVERAMRHAIQTSLIDGQTNSEFVARASLDICMKKMGE